MREMRSCRVEEAPAAASQGKLIETHLQFPRDKFWDSGAELLHKCHAFLEIKIALGIFPLNYCIRSLYRSTNRWQWWWWWW